MSTKLTRRMVLLSVILMDLLAGMEFDLFVPSFPEIQNLFSLTPTWVAALLSVNFIGYCLSLFYVGTMADHYGRKPIITAGLVIFVLGSMLCLWSPTYYVMLVGRFLQGIGIAAPAILSFLIIADAYPIKEQQFLLAMLNGSMNAAVAASPVLGSYIAAYFHWQGNFAALLLLGILVLIMTLLFIPDHKLPERKEKLSLRGYIPILKSGPLMLLIINFVLMCVPYWIFVGMSPLLYMKDLGVSLLHFGYYQGALAMTFAVGSIIYGLIMHRFDQRKSLCVSTVFSVSGLIMVAWASLTNSHNPLLITLAFIPFIIGQIIPSTILYPLALEMMPAAKGRMSALLRALMLVVTAMGLQLAAFYYVGSFQNIGLIVVLFMFTGIVTLLQVISNKTLIKQINHHTEA